MHERHTHMSFHAGADVGLLAPGSVSMGIDSTVSDVREKAHKARKRFGNALRVKNPWRLALTLFATGFTTFAFFTTSTIVRGIYGDLWYGPVAIGGIFAAMTLLQAAFLGKGFVPFFDLVGIILNLRLLNFKTRSLDNHKDKTVRSQLDFVPAIILTIGLLGAGFASAGVSYGVLQKTLYEGAAKIPPNPSDYGNDKAFFMEFFAMAFYYVFLHQSVMLGVGISHISILSGFYMTAMQALGYDISSAAFNFVYWLTVNTIGFHAHFWQGWWVYVAASAATVGLVWAVNRIVFWLYNKAIKYDHQLQAKLQTD